ncbi:arginine N-succinyltransferase, partial [Escherichia coli]|nr:arginine N-succinyltransferase [Escherichia coli]
MLVIHPVENSDAAALMHLASKTGAFLTSLYPHYATHSARIDRSIQPSQAAMPNSEQGFVFVLEDRETGT